MPRLPFILAILITGLTVRTGRAAPPAVPPDHAARMAQGQALFTRHLRSVLIQECLKCHGGDKVRGGLNLSSRESLLKGGDHGPSIVPGKAMESRLFQLVDHTETPHMPPKSPRLAPEVIAHLKNWIDLGAPYDKPLVEKVVGKKEMVVTEEDRKFWSFQPLQRPAVPEVKKGEWVRNPIDRFVLSGLEKKGLTPNGPTERRKLIRRVTLDLIGLPPTPEEVEAFVNDRSPDAYEKLVDRLLASPQHGERWARHWLDLARFAESHGFEHDYDRPTAYHYRDFVIKAFNQDLPYSDFVRWQLAGDEIAPGDPLALTATGFLAAGVHSTQITANLVEKERYDELDDILRTTTTAMLGLTLGCARCHDHKYDPLPARDYYRLLSTFTTTVRTEIDLPQDNKAHELALKTWQGEHEKLLLPLKQYEKDQLPTRLEAWLAKESKKDLSPWTVLEIENPRSKGGATFTRQQDGSLLLSGTNPEHEQLTLTAKTTLRGITSVRLEAMSHPSLVGGGPGRASNGNFALSDFRLEATPLAGGKPIPVGFKSARATFEQAGLPVKAAIDGDKTSAWAVDPQFGKNHAAIFELDRTLDLEGGATLTFTLEFNNNTGHGIARPRLAVTTMASAVPFDAPAVPMAVQKILAQHRADPKANLKPEDHQKLLEWYRENDEGWRSIQAKIDEHNRNKPKAPVVKALISSEGLPAVRLHTQGADFFQETYFLNRGDPSQKQSVATQGFPQVLTRNSQGEKHWQEKPPPGWRTSYQRRSLANWITDVDQGGGALLARVMVNRLWQHHMGRGIVATPSDFGQQGDRPTHPELLEYLAQELIANGWRLKPIHRLMVTSSTYLEDSSTNPEGLRVDSENRLFWRHVPQRLEGEVIRDSILSVSGLLDLKQFGPGTLDLNQRRRSIYFFVKRSQMVPMMVLFDGPDTLQGQEQRTTTTIAPQALLLLNNRLVRDSARALAERVKPGPSVTLSAALERAYQLTLGRSPTPREAGDCLEFVQEQVKSYSQQGKPDASILGLTDFCQVLLGLNEFVYAD